MRSGRMSTIRKADFYYGSLLSVLINNGVAPAIVSPGENRRIYSMTTDEATYEIYTKYASSPSSRMNTSARLWSFSFSNDEIEMIKEYENNGKKYLFALICGDHERMQNSEIAVLTLSQAKNCLDIAHRRESHRITVKKERGRRGLGVYGTGRSDMLNGRDNTLRIARAALPTTQLT